MKKATTITLLALAILAGCKKQEAAENGFDGGSAQGGRYLGVGIYSADELWEQLVQKAPPKDAPPKDPQAALIADDTEVIISVDSRTGEIRQCGNYSGHCIRSNPWKSDAAAAPAALAKHAAELERDREEREQEAAAQARAGAHKP